MEYFKKSNKELLQEILIENQIDSLILRGVYSKAKNKNFGFFTDVTHLNNYYLTYPDGFGDIDSIFILDGNLIDEEAYIFEATLSLKKHRYDRNNPYLLMAKTSTVSISVEINKMDKLLQAKGSELIDLENSIKILKPDFEERKEYYSNRVEQIKQDKQQEADQIIEEYNESIQAKYNEIESTEQAISRLKLEHSITEEKIIELLKTKTDMESSIKFLNQKLELCKNLEFISDNEADKYLNNLIEVSR